MRKLLFSCACFAGGVLMFGNAGAAEPLTPAELAVQMQPARTLGEHAALRTEHCRVLVCRRETEENACCWCCPGCCAAKWKSQAAWEDSGCRHLFL